MISSAYRHLDTNTMPSVGGAGGEGARQQLLWRDDATGATVAINYGPAGFSSKLRELLDQGEHRHYHDTVNERHYILGGDYRIWHYADTESEPTETFLRRHTYLENPPRTLHGSRPHSRPDYATTLLVWNNGCGTSIFDPASRDETPHVPFGQPWPKVNHWSKPIIHHTMEMPWTAHPAQPGWKMKFLSGAVERQAPAMLVSLPPDAGVTGAPKIPGAALRWLYLLSGDLSVTMTAGGKTETINLKEGHFLHWEKDAVLSFGPGAVSDGGCVSICVGHDLAGVRE